MLRKGTDFSRYFRRFSFKGFMKPFMRTKKTKFKNVYTNPRPMTDEDYNYNKAKNQERIDHILDKISKSGYQSLSKAEKDLLFRSSENGKK